MVLTKAPDSIRNVQARVRGSAHFTAQKSLHKLTFQAMSTGCCVQIETPDNALAKDFQTEVLQWIGWFEARYSRFIPDSLVSLINDAAGKDWVEVDPETDALFDLCNQMVFFTRGVFDLTSLPLVRLWNWKARPPVIPDDSAIRRAQELVGWRKVQRRPGGIYLPQEGMCIDFGGIGKEYAVDRVLMMALGRGFKNVLVDFGQDVRVHGEAPGCGAWHIGLQDPRDLSRCWTGVAVNNHAVATSGDGVRHFFHEGRRYGHILDPRTGHPVNNGALSVSVIAPY